MKPAQKNTKSAPIAFALFTHGQHSTSGFVAVPLNRHGNKRPLLTGYHWQRGDIPPECEENGKRNRALADVAPRGWKSGRMLEALRAVSCYLNLPDLICGGENERE